MKSSIAGLNKSSSELKSPRLANIDVAKGLGIALVVHGHLSGFLVDAIFLVHMPLFFIVGGILSRNDPSSGISRRLLSMVIPYTVFLILLWVIPSVFLYFQGDLTEAEFIKQIGKAVIGGEALISIAAVFWFPAAYAFMLILAGVVFERSVLLRVLISGPAICIAIGVSVMWPEFYLPLSLNVAPIAFVFYLVGRMFRTHDFGTFSAINLALVFFGIAALIGVECGLWPSMNMKRAEFGIPFLTLFASTAGVLALLVLSAVISKFNASRPIAYIGKASLFIMYTHMGIALFLRLGVSIPGTWLALLTLMICMMLYEIVRHSRALSLAFLGKIPDGIKFLSAR